MAAKKKTKKAAKPRKPAKTKPSSKAVAPKPASKAVTPPRKPEKTAPVPARGKAASPGPKPAAPPRQRPPPIDASEHPLVVRTSFSDDEAWQTICETIREPVGEDGFLANVTYLDDRAYTGTTKDELLELVEDGYTHSFIILADRAAMRDPDYAVLVVDLDADRGRELRALPSQIQSIENNLSLANMEFEEFAEAAGDDGVFRGFE